MANGDTGTVKKRGRPKGSKDSKKRSYPSQRHYTPEGLVAKEKSALKMSTKVAVTEEGKAYNARLIEHVMRIHEIAAKCDRKDLLSMKSCFVAYLQLCQEDGFSVNNMAAYASMGFYDQNHFYQFERTGNDPERKAFCAFVRQTCAMFREGMIADSKINPVIGIFWQRNFDGLRNDTEQVQNPQGESFEDTDTGRSYKDKYQNLIGG